MPCSHTHPASDISGAPQSAHSEGTLCSPEEHTHPSVTGFDIPPNDTSPHGLGRQWLRVRGRWHEESVGCLCRFAEQASQQEWLEAPPLLPGMKERTFARGHQQYINFRRASTTLQPFEEHPERVFNVRNGVAYTGVPAEVTDAVDRLCQYMLRALRCRRKYVLQAYQITDAVGGALRDWHWDNVDHGDLITTRRLSSTERRSPILMYIVYKNDLSLLILGRSSRRLKQRYVRMTSKFAF